MDLEVLEVLEVVDRIDDVRLTGVINGEGKDEALVRA